MPPVRVRTPPVVEIFGALPPLLLKVSPVRLIADANVSVAPPFNVTDCGAMTPPATWVSVPPLTVMPTPLAGAGSVPVTPTVRLMPLTTVPPVNVFVPRSVMTPAEE